ncbi:MAG: hypothetical protein SOZ80_08955 [Prevotella sp.]|uniref:hypothetical protein n=1 Tax=Prevotella sp. TaxID=59823 RepID=UPI002A33068F|nr:hypothetical protein [Prevotella sp.]MDD7318226.1 hypothetical protein [Prevotellaceae bacterium]MDY4020885.1 hypothetical protein [Prevotella sp.]
MRRILITMALVCMAIVSVNAQERYKAALQMAREVAEDEKKDVGLRKIATFKYDELCYMGQRTVEQMPEKSAELDDQALALFEFIDLYLSNFEKASKKQQSKVLQDFKMFCIEFPRYDDNDTTLTEAYYNENYITQFNLNTDWVKAYEKARTIYKK